MNFSLEYIFFNLYRSTLATVLADTRINNYNVFSQKGDSSAFSSYLAGKFMPSGLFFGHFETLWFNGLGIS